MNPNDPQSACPGRRLFQTLVLNPESVRRPRRTLRCPPQSAATPPHAHPTLCPALAHAWVSWIQPETPGPRPALTRVEQPAGAAAVRRSDRCGRLEDARGSHACSAEGPSASQPSSSARRTGSAPHPLLFSSRSLPPRPRARTAQPARHRLPFPSPPASSQRHPAIERSRTLRPRAGGSPQRFTTSGSPTPCPCTGSDGRILPVTLAPSRSRQHTPSSRGSACLESAKAMLRHGRSHPILQSSSTPGARSPPGRFVKLNSTL